jgi:acyl-ACP thioesterase
VSGAAGPAFDLQPLVERPADVRCFSQERHAGVAEVAPSARVRLDTIARWVQDVAWDDVDDAGLRELTIWLVRRTRMRVHRFPRLDERYRLTTYVTGLGRMWAERRTDIVRIDVPSSEPLVEVSCIWVHIDPTRLLPSRVDQREIDMWCGPSTRTVKARLRHPAPPESGFSEGQWTFRASEVDLAEHVNNAAYFTPFDDELLGLGEAAAAVDSVDMEIEYRNPAQAGEMRMLSAGPMRWVVDAAGDVAASAVLADWPA